MKLAENKTKATSKIGCNKQLAHYCVYMHITPSNKVYIGLTGRSPEARWCNGSGYQYNPHFSNAIKKYGWDNIKHKIVRTDLTKEEAISLEIDLIRQYDATNQDKGYNISFGGQASMLGRKHSQETKRKMSEKAKNRTWSEERRARASVRMKKKIATDEAYRERIFKALEKAKEADHSWTSEHRKNFHDATVGHEVSQEVREKLSRAHKGMKLSEEAKLKISKSQQKPVVCLETGQLFESINDAAAYYEVSKPCIGVICREQKGTVKGLHFCFKRDLPENTPKQRKDLIAKMESERKRITKRQVYCVETKIVYKTITEAAQAVGTNRSRILRACKKGSVAGNFHWECYDS